MISNYEDTSATFTEFEELRVFDSGQLSPYYLQNIGWTSLKIPYEDVVHSISLTNGYIVFELYNTEINSTIFTLLGLRGRPEFENDGLLYELYIYGNESYANMMQLSFIVFSQEDGVVTMIDNIHGTLPMPPSTCSFKFEYSQDGHGISYNGIQQQIDYTNGSNTNAIYLGPLIQSFGFNIGSPALLGAIRNVEFGSGNTAKLQYPLTNPKDYIQEVTHDNDGAFIEYAQSKYFSRNGLAHAQLPGYDSIPWIKGVERPTFEIEEDSFQSIPDGLLDTPPTDEQWALFVDKTTGEPLIRLGEPWTSNNYPIWTDITPNDILRNPNLWYTSKAITSFSVLADLNDYKTNVILLSPRHALISEHIRGNWGEDGYKTHELTWMDMDSNFQSTSAIDYEAISGVSSDEGVQSYPNISILLLDSPISLDVEYAKFLSEGYSNNSERKILTSVGPTKEGVFCIEQVAGMAITGLRYPAITQAEYQWSRFNPTFNKGRVGDDSRPVFIYNGDELLFTVTLSWGGDGTTFPYGGYGSDGMGNYELGGFGTSYMTRNIEEAMKNLDLRHGITSHYALQRGN